MTEIPAAIVVALIGLGGTVLGLVITWLGSLTRRLRRMEHRDRLSWLYIRSLIDHAYRNASGIPLPEPPEGWLEE